MDERQESLEPAVQDETERKPSKRRNTLLYATIIVIAVFLAIPYWYTSNPVSCTRCHEMTPYYKSWQESSHATAAKNCFECHVKAGAINLWMYRISFYREIYASMTGAKLKPAGASLPGVDSCQKHGCHSLNRVSSSSGDIKINHRTHIKQASISCVVCHMGVVHTGVAGIGKALPSRDLCKSCHNSVMNDCSFCHNKRFAPGTIFTH